MRISASGRNSASRAFTHSDCHNASFEPREPMTK
jgi:hypothetical protein